MRKFLLAAAFWLAALPAFAQNNGVTSGNQVVPGSVNFCFTGATNSDGSLAVQPCNASNPLPVSVGTAAPGTSPLGVTNITGAGTGTTGAVTATLTSAANNTTYICGFTVSAIGGTATIGPITVANTLTSNLIYQAASPTNLVQNFTPCIPATGANTNITVTTTADGTATAVDVNAWGFNAPSSIAAYPYTNLTGNATGTTGSVVGTLSGAATKLTYICGFSVSAVGSGNVGPIVIANTITGNLTYPLVAAATGANVGASFTPCIPANAVNTNITVTTTADGTATAVDVNSWGFRQ